MPSYIAIASPSNAARILPTRNGNLFLYQLSTIPLPCARILPTRNGNGSQFQASGGLTAAHGSYLQGMETIMSSILWYGMRPHGSYLQGMETITPPCFRVIVCKHGSYLQGMETLLCLANFFFQDCARILPTRNGNLKCLKHDLVS